MIKRLNLSIFVAGCVCLTGSVFAQLAGDYPVDLSSIKLPVFNGVVLEETVSATSFELTMVQGLTSSKLTGTGSISATDFVADDTLVVNFEGSMSFSAGTVKAGSIVRLTGAKATLGRDVTGTGTYSDEENGDLDVTVTKVIGAFGFKSLTVDLESDEIEGLIAKGKLSVSGYLTDTPREKGTVRVDYGEEEFGPFSFPADNLITPEIALVNLVTSSKNKITGTATGTFGDYDEVPFSLRGTRNARTGISVITLTGTGAGKRVSATLNLDENGEITGTNNALNVLGYKLKF